MKAFLFAGLTLMMFSGCDVDVKDKGKLPKVNVESGRLPDVDVRAVPKYRSEPRKPRSPSPISMSRPRKRRSRCQIST